MVSLIQRLSSRGMFCSEGVVVVALTKKYPALRLTPRVVFVATRCKPSWACAAQSGPVQHSLQVVRIPSGLKQAPPSL